MLPCFLHLSKKAVVWRLATVTFTASPSKRLQAPLDHTTADTTVHIDTQDQATPDDHSNVTVKLSNVKALEDHPVKVQNAQEGKTTAATLSEAARAAQQNRSGAGSLMRSEGAQLHKQYLPLNVMAGDDQVQSSTSLTNSLPQPNVSQITSTTEAPPGACTSNEVVLLSQRQGVQGSQLPIGDIGRAYRKGLRYSVAQMLGGCQGSAGTCQAQVVQH